MSMATLERAVTAEARTVLKNPKLRVKDLLEWSTGQVKVQTGEVTAFLPELQIHIAVKKEMDKRK